MNLKPWEFNPTKGSNRRLDIQSLRAIAVILVVGFHSGLPIPGGFVGVDIFFVISGFVITSILLRENKRYGRISWRRFYLKRFKRLAPALALVITVILISSVFLLSPSGTQQIVAQTGIGAILLGANLVIPQTTGGYFDPLGDTNPLLHTWSLSVEEQFYLFFPLIFVLGWLLSRERSRVPVLILLMSCLAVISFGLALTGSSGLSFPGSNVLLGFYSPLTRAWEFAAGALLVLVLSYVKLSPGKVTLTVTGILGILAVAASLFLITPGTPFPGFWTLAPVFGVVLILFAGSWENRLSLSLSTGPLPKLGDISYSLYLWHWPAIVFSSLIWPGNGVAIAGAVLVSLALAVSSYHLVERPFQLVQTRRLKDWITIASVTVLMPLAAASALLLANHEGWWSKEVKSFQIATTEWHIGLENGCDTRDPLGLSSVDCHWNPTGLGPPIYLLGDSNADHFSEGVILAGEALDRPTVISSTNSCPFITGALLDLDKGGRSDKSCAQYVEGSIDFLMAASPGTVIISNTNSYWASSRFEFGPTPENVSSDPNIKVSRFESELSLTAKTLMSGGHTVILVQTVPKWDGRTEWDPSECDLLSVRRGDCSATQSLSNAQNATSSVRTAVAAAASNSGASVWDPGQDICPAGICSTDGPGFYRYKDNTHLSVPQAEALAPTIAVLLNMAGLDSQKALR